ncbi:MAG: SufD family Fe-S cluster assembly protein [Bacilli bacterium]|nr:SufD family Fe-S cluster assembly protein [Bacilli bacterium]
MKYTLNKLHEKTTNNFKINDITLDFELPEIKSFHDYEIVSNELEKIKIEISEKEVEVTSKIGLTLPKTKVVKLTIPKYVEIREPIIITYNFKENDSLVDTFEVTFEESSSADIILKYKSLDNGTHFHHYKEVLVNEKNSKGSISIVNLLNKNSKNFTAIENKTYENANITHNIIDLNGEIRLTNIDSESVEYKSTNTVNNVYIGKEKQVIDMNYYLKNTGRETNNQLKVEGSLNEESRKNFRGTIDFVKGCNNSIGEENENCVLLSNKVVARSLPELLCGEEDVQGAHGISSGKVDAEKLFYIMSRGYSKKEAEKIIIIANFTSIINEIKDDTTKEEILKEIENI